MPLDLEPTVLCTLTANMDYQILSSIATTNDVANITPRQFLFESPNSSMYRSIADGYRYQRRKPSKPRALSAEKSEGYTTFYDALRRF